MTASSPPAAATAAMRLMLLLGALWVCLALLIALSAHPAMHIPGPWNLVMAGLMLAVGLAAFGLAVLLRRRSRPGYYGALALLAASAVAVVFDQIGWVDLLFAAANIIPTVLLLRARVWYLGS